MLTPGGMVVVLTDLVPDEFVFFKRHADSFLLPFTGKPGDNIHIPYLAMTAEQAETFGNLQPPALKEFWFAYMDLEEPWERAIVKRLTYGKQMRALQFNMTRLYLRRELGFEPKVIDVAQNFHIEAAQAMEKIGLRNVDINLEKGEFVGPPSAIQDPGVEYRYAFGRLFKTPKASLKPHIKEIAHIGVITAIK